MPVEYVTTALVWIHDLIGYGVILGGIWLAGKAIVLAFRCGSRTIDARFGSEPSEKPDPSRGPTFGPSGDRLGDDDTHGAAPGRGAFRYGLPNEEA